MQWSGWRKSVMAMGAAAVLIAGLAPAEQPTSNQAAGILLPLPSRSTVLPVRDCASLKQADFAGVAEAPTSIREAAVEPATDARAEFCHLTGYVATDIQFDLRLPTRTWTGRYLQGGCGGNCGVIGNQVSPACDNRVVYGGSFAVGFENSGHSGGDGVWARMSDEAREDFAHRAAHAFALASKAIIASYYGVQPSFSYFQGCSDGGREAMMESQRYPHDFNGIIAGSPAFAITEAMERFIWEAHWNHDADGKPVLDGDAVRLLHAAVIQACDKLDGLVDGQIDDPRRCKLDPATLRCRQPKAPPACLSEAQIEVARKLYQGPVDETGEALFYGGEPYGAELTWLEGFALSRAGPHMLRDAVRDMIYQGQLDPAVTVDTWKFDRATFDELRRRGGLYDANDPQLGAFRDAGGKLLLWQGFADPAAGAYGLADYYARLARADGGYDRIRQFARLYLIPGVYHCRGGYVPYDEDLLGALVNWVEAGRTPDYLLARATLDTGKERSRPVFAYPQSARYRGGDIDAAASFVAASPQQPPEDVFRWAGASP